MKKLVALSLCALFVLGTVVGCGAKTGEKTGDKTESAPAKSS